MAFSARRDLDDELRVLPTGYAGFLVFFGAFLFLAIAVSPR